MFEPVDQKKAIAAGYTQVEIDAENDRRRGKLQPVNQEVALDAGYTLEEIDEENGRRLQNAFPSRVESGEIGVPITGDPVEDQRLRQEQKQAFAAQQSNDNNLDAAVQRAGNINPVGLNPFEMFNKNTLSGAKNYFNQVSGERVGLEPNDLVNVRQGLDVVGSGGMTPLVDALVGTANVVGGGLAAATSLGADYLGRQGVPDTNLLKRDVGAMLTETPFVGVNPQIASARMPKITMRNPNIDNKFQQLPAPRQPQGPSTAVPPTSSVNTVRSVTNKIGEKASNVLGAVNEKIDNVFPPRREANKLIKSNLEFDYPNGYDLPALVQDFTMKNNRLPNLIEITKDNTNSLARLSSSNVGKGKNTMETYREKILDGQTEQVLNIANQSLANPLQDFTQQFSSINRQMQKEAQPYYDSAHAQIVPLNDKIKSFLNTPAGIVATKNAVKLMQQEQKNLSNLGVNIVKNKPVLNDNVSVELLDYIKRSFDDQIEKFRDGTTQVLNLDNMGRAINKSLRNYILEVDQLSPDYAKAREIYSGNSALKNAMADGRQAGSKNRVTADDITIRLDRMTKSEKDIYKSGFMRGLLDIMVDGNLNANRINKLIKSEGLQNKINAIFQNPTNSKKFIDMLKVANESGRKAQQISTRIGTSTEPTRAAGESYDNMARGGFIQSAVEKGVSMVRQNRNERNKQIKYADIADLITKPLTPEHLKVITDRLNEP